MDTAVSAALTAGQGDLATAILGVLATAFTAGIAVYLSVKGLAFGWSKFKKYAGVGRRS